MNQFTRKTNLTAEEQYYQNQEDCIKEIRNLLAHHELEVLDNQKVIAMIKKLMEEYEEEQATVTDEAVKHE